MELETSNLCQVSKVLLMENNIEANINLSNTSLAQVPVAHPIVKAWTYWLGANLVWQWRTLSVEEWTLAVIFEEYNPEFNNTESSLLNLLQQSRASNGSFLIELDAKYQEISQQQLIAKSLIPTTSSFTDSLSKSTQDCLKQLHANLEEVRIAVHQKLQIYFYSLKSAGTKEAFAYLVSLNQKLQNLIKEYEWQWQECLHKKNTSRRSMENLSVQLSHWWQFSHQKANSAMKALLLTYKFELEAHLCDAACQLLRELETQTQQHILLVTEVDSWLATLQSMFMQQCPLEPVATDFLKYHLAQRINAAQLQEEIADWAKSSLYEWATIESIEIQCLTEQFLTRLQPVCQDFYNECFQIK